MSVILGDCLVEMRKLPESSVDCVVTDIPYGINFMGKDWDKAVPSVEIWKECLRVLKPGAFAFIMSLPRLDVQNRIAVRLQEAGFNIGFTPIYWVFSQGFPKAMNIGKVVDRKLGAEREVVGFNELSKGIRPGSHNIVGDVEYKAGHPITVPSSPAAMALDGSYAGFQPKPAVEVIIVAMKPLSEGTYVEQAMKNGKGVTWLDDGRIPSDSEKDDMLRETNRSPRISQTWEKGSGFKNEKVSYTGIPSEGRFPANLLVSDDALNDGKEHSSGHMDCTTKDDPATRNVYGEMKPHPAYSRGDTGSPSRMFSLEAWWAERVRSLPKEAQATFPFFIVPKASQSERNRGVSGEGKFMDEGREVGSPGGTNPRNRGAEHRRPNFHPTVKPVALMSYLVTLGSRPGDVVLDPFAGSGTTAIACALLGRKFTGMEINPEYYRIAVERMRAVGGRQSFLEPAP